MTKQSSRNVGMDVLRSIALFCVIAVHFFLNSGFYNELVVGGDMFLMILLRNSLMICVPIFLLLSGYLLNRKTPEPAYYLRIVRIIFIYLAASACCALYSIYMKKSGMTLAAGIAGMLSYTTAPYAWYIEMYLGLFLLIPFLNVLYHALSSQQMKKSLLVTLLLLTAVPGMLNMFRVDSLEWWLRPSMEHLYQQLFPKWWQTLYPVTYYYFGCYLKEYPLRMKKTTHVLLLAAVCLLAGGFNYYRSYNSVFLWGSWQEWGSVLITMQAVLVFSLFSQMRYDRMGDGIKAIFRKVSECALGAYLVSWIFDDIVYNRLNVAIPVMKNRMPWFVVVVPVVIISSVLLSWVINLLYDVTFGKAVAVVQNRIKNAQ